MGVRFRWLGYVCFEFVLPSGKVLVVDPYIDYSPTAPIKCSEVTGADYIALTHGHYDHLTDVGQLLHKFHSKVLCSQEIAEPLARVFNIDLGDLIRVSAGDRVHFSDLRIEVKRGQHINLLPPMRQAYARLLGKEADSAWAFNKIQKEIETALNLVQKPETAAMLEKLDLAGVTGGEQLNFLFQTEDNLRLFFYSSGPEDHLRPVAADAQPQVIFIQLGGTDLEKMADVAAISGAGLVIPTHHDGNGVEGSLRIAGKFADLLAKKTKAQFINIEHGKWYEIATRCQAV
ncbi:MAG: MBL fold metallo-hydrolase [Thermodesulfobacteriota bacterium]|jgi:L-ascorbate metabolism protein UlaG (beta-lactamase superfamily)